MFIKISIAFSCSFVNSDNTISDHNKKYTLNLFADFNFKSEIEQLVSEIRYLKQCLSEMIM